ncbi:MAG: hypothetical protein V4559_08930 [Pseudomonadota bacterium]
MLRSRGGVISDLFAPAFASWDDYLARTAYAERMNRCHAAAKRANRVHCCKWRRAYIGRDPWSVLMREETKKPCECCGSEVGNGCLGGVRLKGGNIWAIVEAAKGRCVYCGSLAVESRPSHAEKGSPLRWHAVGRRIGSLEHFAPYLDGRMNGLANLRWSCLWCNVHREARIPGALDHGGYHPA